MYYPYLRGKQFELKALKEFSSENQNKKTIIPIIEPVNQATNALSTAIEELMKNGMRFALVLNPNDGDYRHENVVFRLHENDQSLTCNLDKWIPAFIYCDNAAEILEQIKKFRFDNVMIIFHSCADIDDPIVLSLLRDENVSYIVNNFGNSTSRRIKRGLKDLGKSLICLDDCFVTRKKNAEYGGTNSDELFTDMPFYWEDEGYQGFSDYTALSSEYSDGGTLPYALVIHLTYKKSQDQIYIHHFVSDSNFDQSNIKGKFNEAAIKIAPFFAEKKHTPVVDELIEKATSDNGFPGLGYLKKLAIKNHLQIINEIL